MSKVALSGNASGTGTVTLASPNTNNNPTFTLPSADGTNGQVLQTNGSGTLSFANATSLASPLVVTGNSTAGAEIRLPEDTDNGSNYVALKAADNLASNLTFTLPSADGTSGQVLQTNGSGALSFTTPAGGFSTAQVFTSSGTFTVPSSGKFQVTICGGGGGGAGFTSTGSGGSSGGTCIKWYTGITPGTSCTVTIGSGGTGQTSGGTAATNGGNSSFSGSGVTTLTANGGAATGGSGGSASGGDINIAGMPGGVNIVGGSGFDYAGEGGGSFFGPGGTRVGLNVSGRNAQAYGAGGSGGSSFSGGAVNGGNGAGGICIVEY